MKLKYNNIYKFFTIFLLYIYSPISLAFAVQTGNGTDVFIGNVGIGTTTPQGKLIVTSGNVGVGTWVPSERLDVIGTVKATTFSGDGSGLTGISAGGWSGAGSYIYLATATNNVGLGTTTPQGSLVVTNGNVGIGTWNPQGSLVVRTGNVGFGTWPTINNTLQVVGVGTLIPGSGLSVMDGNVGIGTWVPRTQLDVNLGTIRAFRIQSTSTSTTGSGAISYGHVGTSNTIISSGSGSFAMGSTSGTNGTITSSNSGSMAMGYAQDGGTPGEIRASSIGSIALGAAVGIGTTAGIYSSGTGSLAVGYGFLGGIISASGGGSVAMGYAGSAEVTSASNTAAFALGQNITASAANSYALGQSFTNNRASTFSVGFSSLPTLNVTSTSVAIGTFTPASKLTLMGNMGIGTIGGAFVTNAAPANGLIVEGNTGIGTYAPQTAFVSMGNVGIGTWTAAGGNLIVKGGGNVGIGSSWPGTAVDVIGTVRASNFVGDGSGLTGITAGGWSGSGTNVYLATATNNVGLGTTTPQGSFVVTNGNVGIGTFAPKAALVVNGNAGIGTLGPVTSTFQVVGIGTLIPGSGLSVLAGNVGVGTIVPSASVDVIGTLKLSGNGSATTTNFSSTSSSAKNADAFTFADSTTLSSAGTDSKNILSLTSSNVASNVTASFSGNVINVLRTNISVSGSGVLNQAGALAQFMDASCTGVIGGTCNSSSDVIDIIQNISTNTGTALLVTSQGLGNVLRINDDGQLVDPTPFIVDADGNLGVGTVTAGSKLVLAGGGIGIGTNMNSSFVQTTAPLGGMIVQGNVGVGTTAPQGGFVVTNGNVGIGTWAPQGGLVIMNGNVGIGTSRPLVLLEISTNTSGSQAVPSGGTIIHATGTDGAKARVAIDAFGAGSFSTINLRAARGTAANPSAVTANSAIGALYATGWATTGYGGGTTIGFNASETWADGSNGSYMFFETTPNGSGTKAERMRIDQAGNVGINTAAPNFTLNVNGNIGIGTAVGNQNYLKSNNMIVFASEYNNGNSGAAPTINWNNGNKQSITLDTAAITYTFTAPTTGVGNYLLKMIQDGTGNRGTANTWPASVKWSGGAPTLSTGAAAIDIITCYYDGTNYFCSFSLNFQ